MVTLHEYNLFQSSDLEINDMIKISFKYDNAYRWSINQYIGRITEHIWCKILEILPNNNLKVLVSNNCYFSESGTIIPLKYEDIITVNISNIKEQKKVNNEIYQEQFKKIWHDLPEIIKLILQSLPKEKAIIFFEAYLSKINLNK